MADQHLPTGFLMIVRDILGTFEAILGHVGAILVLSWEDLGATWVHFGACKSEFEKQKTFIVERCDGASTPDLLMKPI